MRAVRYPPGTHRPTLSARCPIDQHQHPTPGAGVQASTEHPESPGREAAIPRRAGSQQPHSARTFGYDPAPRSTNSVRREHNILVMESHHEDLPPEWRSEYTGAFTLARTIAPWL